MTYDIFCQIHEDVLEWLLDVEDKLKTMEAVTPETLSDAKALFNHNDVYMKEVGAQHGEVGRVIITKHEY